MGAVRFDRWLGVLSILGAGAVVVVLGLLDGNPTTTVIMLVVLAGFGWWSWPARRGPHVSHAQAQSDAGPDDVVIYWRPG